MVLWKVDRGRERVCNDVQVPVHKHREEGKMLPAVIGGQAIPCLRGMDFLGSKDHPL